MYFFLEDIFPNQPGGRKLLMTPGVLRTLFDTPEEDPAYSPLPEDQAGMPQDRAREEEELNTRNSTREEEEQQHEPHDLDNQQQ